MTEHPLRVDTRARLAAVRAQWRQQGPDAPLWVLGYASLIWRPEFQAVEHRTATLHGWHRTFRMRSNLYRGTPERPGLVCALISGGTCRAMVYRVAPEQAEEELERLWHREMPTGTYQPRWLRCRTASGEVLALAFTLSRRSPSYTGRLDEAQLLDILRHARGQFGSSLDYLRRTAEALHQHRLHDRECQRLLALARRHGLLAEVEAPPGNLCTGAR